jgi:hypothetical protein
LKFALKPSVPVCLFLDFSFSETLKKKSLDTGKMTEEIFSIHERFALNFKLTQG